MFLNKLLIEENNFKADRLAGVTINKLSGGLQYA